MDARCSWCGRPRLRFLGLRLCAACDRLDAWPSWRAFQAHAGEVMARLRHPTADLDLEAPEEKGDPR